MKNTGFTLIELIIVIAVIAILATTVILVINPVNILREARDSQRIADLGQMSSAMGLYLATVASPSLGAIANCYVQTGTDAKGVSAGCAYGAAARHGAKTAVVDPDRLVDGTGWVPVNLNSVSGGAPLSAWPVDPVNNAVNFYSYSTAALNTTYELNANMESTRYASGGSDDVEGTDGGNVATIYEVGNDPGLDDI